jgi:hypothetical protein
MSAENHPYRTGIITSIAAAIIWSFIPGWSWTFHAIGRAVSLVFTWRIPFWLIILLIALAIFLFVLWRKWEPRTFQEEEFYQYKQDRFFNAVWRWSYDRTALPTDAASFCPNCDMQLVFHESHGAYLAAGLTNTLLICERCNQQIADVEGDYDHLERRVLREIERMVRTGEYKRVLANNVSKPELEP